MSEEQFSSTPAEIKQQAEWAVDLLPTTSKKKLRRCVSQIYVLEVNRKKSITLNPEEIHQFLQEALDEKILFTNVIFNAGFIGTCYFLFLCFTRGVIEKIMYFTHMKVLFIARVYYTLGLVHHLNRCMKKKRLSTLVKLITIMKFYLLLLHSYLIIA